MSLRIIATVTFSLLVLASFYGLSRLSACELDTRKQGHLLPANIAHAAAAEAALAAPPNPASQPHASSSPSDPSPVRHCTEQEKKTQVSLIRHAKVKGCSGKGDVLMRIVQLASPKSRVFIDIGSNKGYSGAHFFQLWAAHMRLDPMTLMRAVGHSCGVCGDCNDATAPLIGDFPAKRRGEESPSIRVYSFDGSTLNAQNLRQGIAALASNHSFNGLAKMWTSENAALAETYVAGATVKFVSQREVGHIASADEDLAGKTVVIVPVLTIDAIVERERLGFVDVIKVDTEGFDPLVLRGGRVTLQAHKTVLLLFEYHFVWPNTTSLKQTTRELQDWGYVCYLEGQRTLLKLTHDCWADELEVRSWSNVWCLSTRRRQGLAIASVFDTLCQGFED